MAMSIEVSLHIPAVAPYRDPNGPYNHEKKCRFGAVAMRSRGWGGRGCCTASKLVTLIVGGVDLVPSILTHNSHWANVLAKCHHSAFR